MYIASSTAAGALIVMLVETFSSGMSANRASISLIEEIEATAGQIPLREVGRRAALEAEREANVQRLRKERLEQVISAREARAKEEGKSR